MHYHVVITGSRPDLKDGKYLPVPDENIAFIHAILSKVPAENMTIYHGAAKGVDNVADDYAFLMNVRTQQFPAYWSVWDDGAKRYVTDKAAGPKRNREMVNKAISDAYGKDDHTVVVLAFYNTPTLEDSKGTAQCINYAERKHLTVRTYELPVKKGSTPVNEAPTQTDVVPF